MWVAEMNHGWMMAIGVIHSLMFWILALLGAIALWTWLKQQSRSSNRPSSEVSALEILKQRYARGEIDRESYQQMRQDLEK